MKLLEQAAGGVLRTSMELGGNAPFVVFEDADLDKAVDGAMLAKFRNIGQACTAANRFIVHRSVADEFARRVTEKVQAFKIGRGTEEGVTIGPLIDDRAVDEGRRRWCRMPSRAARRVTHRRQRRSTGPGTFYQPTVVTDVQPGSDILREEIFGPVLAIVPFDDEDDAVRIANDTEYGLVSYVFTENLARGQRMIERLETGMMGLNVGVVSNAAAPFGGWKSSGLGREGGAEGIHEYLQTKYTLTAEPVHLIVARPVVPDRPGRSHAMIRTHTRRERPSSVGVGVRGRERGYSAGWPRCAAETGQAPRPHPDGAVLAARQDEGVDCRIRPPRTAPLAPAERARAHRRRGRRAHARDAGQEFWGGRLALAARTRGEVDRPGCGCRVRPRRDRAVVDDARHHPRHPGARARVGAVGHGRAAVPQGGARPAPRGDRRGRARARRSARCARALRGGNGLARKDMFAVSEGGGVSTQGQRGYHLLFALSVRGILCQGRVVPRAGRADPRAVLRAARGVGARCRVPADPLAEFFFRYIASHGPAGRATSRGGRAAARRLARGGGRGIRSPAGRRRRTRAAVRRRGSCASAARRRRPPSSRCRRSRSTTSRTSTAPCRARRSS